MGWFSNRNTDGNNERLSGQLIARNSAVRRARSAQQRDDSADNRRRLSRTQTELASWRDRHPGWL